MKTTHIILIAVVAIVGAVIALGSLSRDVEAVADMTTYKSPTCGCCSGWIGYASGQGYNTETRMSQDLTPIKNKHSIPSNMQSCHTSEVEGYFVEGHVPIEAVNKLVEERPDIDGIALPGMPSGTPGMPGPKNEDWVIYAVKDGQVVGEFMRI